MQNTPNVKKLGFNWPKLERIEGDIARLEEDRQATLNRLGALRLERQTAETKDREAYAAALLEGKDDPGSENVARVEAERERLEKRHQALDTALRKLAIDRAGVVRANRVAWQRDVRERVPAIAGRLREASAEVRDAVSEMSALVNLLAWLGSPETGYKAPARSNIGNVSVNGHAVGIHAVFEAVLSRVAEVEASAKRSAEDSLRESA